jgi:hypothetical protein
MTTPPSSARTKYKSPTHHPPLPRHSERRLAASQRVAVEEPRHPPPHPHRPANLHPQMPVDRSHISTLLPAGGPIMTASSSCSGPGAASISNPPSLFASRVPRSWRGFMRHERGRVYNEPIPSSKSPRVHRRRLVNPQIPQPQHSKADKSGIPLTRSHLQ